MGGGGKGGLDAQSLSLKEEGGIRVGLWGGVGLRWGGGFPLIIHRQYSVRGFFHD